MDESGISKTQRVGREHSFGNVIRNASKGRRMLWILVVAVVLLTVLTWENYTLNQFARATLKLVILQVSQ